MKCDEVEQLGMHQDKEESKEKGIPEKKEERLVEGEGCGVAKKPLQQQCPRSSSQPEWLAPSLQPGPTATTSVTLEEGSVSGIFV